MARNRRKVSEPAVEPKKVDSTPKVEEPKKVIAPKVQKVEEDEIPTTNPVLLRNRYDNAMIEVKKILSSEKLLKEYLAQKSFKFKFV
jgi:hypothetical protein